MNYDDEGDSVLMNMIGETNEEVRNSLYEKYVPLIQSIVKRYSSTARKLGIDKNDLLQEANVGFTDAINHFNEEKDASFKTFMQVCIERKLINYIKKHQSTKHKIIQDSLSLDYEYNEDGNSLKEMIGDIRLDPSIKYSEKETEKNRYEKIKKELSQFEYEVFLYMMKDLNYNEIAKILDKSPKQIDITMQRVRFKIKTILKEE